MAKTVADDILVAVETMTGGPEYSTTINEAALQTFKKGWVVAVDGGFVTDAYTNHGNPPTAIWGVAAEDSHNDAVAGTHQVNVYMIPETNLFAGNVKGATLANYVGLASDIGGLFGIQRDTTNNRIFLDASVRGGANVRVIVLQTAQNTDIGDTNPRYVFAWLQNQNQAAGTS